MSMQSYWMSLFVIPKRIIKKVEVAIRAFLWKGPELGNGGAKVAWADLTFPKEEGGLGIRKLSEWNEALISKFIWDIWSPTSTSNWARWARANLLQGRSFWDIPITSTCSWAWRKILQLREKVCLFIRYDIGDGCSTFLWFDYWLPLGPIQSTMGDRVIYDSRLRRDAKVSSIIRAGSWAWLVENSTGLITLKKSIPTQIIPHPDKEDCIVWTMHLGGYFSISSAWKAFRVHRPLVEWASIVWFSGSLPKASFILWLAIRGRLSTQDRLFNISPAACCSLCGDNLEDHNHLFFTCAFSR